MIKHIHLAFGRHRKPLTSIFLCQIGNSIPQIKVAKILKGSPDSISSPSPSVKIQIMGWKVCLRFKGKTLLGLVNKTFENKKSVVNTQQCFALTPQANFPANNLNFH